MADPNQGQLRFMRPGVGKLRCARMPAHDFRPWLRTHVSVMIDFIFDFRRLSRRSQWGEHLNSSLHGHVGRRGIFQVWRGGRLKNEERSNRQ